MRYFETIEKYADCEIDSLISNSDISHISAILKIFFLHAKETVYISARGANMSFVLNSYKGQEMSNFLKHRSGKLIIATTFQDRKEKEVVNTFLSDILSNKERQGTIEVWDSSPSLEDGVNDFILMDGKAYLLILDNNVGKAVANFGDKNTANRLDKMFRTILEKSTKEV